MTFHPNLKRSLALCGALVLAGCASLSNRPQAGVAGAPSLLAKLATPPAASTAVAGAPATAGTAAAVIAAGSAAAPVAAAASMPAANSGPRPDPVAPKPFDEVIKGAVVQDGFVPLWRKDERVWLEISPERLDQPFMLSANISHSVGERRLYASQMGPSWLVSFRKIGATQLQLIALNTNYVADNPAMKSAVEQGFSNSLLASSTILSAPHPQRKSVLIDASFLLSDLPGYSTLIEAAFRMPYNLDRGNSYFEKTRVSDDMTTLNARIHFATPRLPAPPSVPGAGPMASPPTTTPDARSFFVGYVYSLTRLPAVPMAARRTDPRLGHFYDAVTNLSTDLEVNPRTHYINRWRLDKKDASAALSEPVEPIVYWLDKNIPPRYRASVEAGILEWNKAFEKIGFKDAIVVRQQADDADWDNMDARHASIRWFVGSDVGFAIGPVQTDPRTGEIIDADIGMSDVFGRRSRRLIVEDVAVAAEPGFAPLATAWRNKIHAATCNYAHESAAQLDFALDMLESRGELSPDGPEAEAFVQSVIKDTVMHEVGHTLGLKHNFKGSTAVTRAQLRDKAFTEQHGTSGSVMDYNAINLAVAGEPQAALNNSTLGPYDYWAIEYAYQPFDAATEKAGLSRIAARSNEPQLAYADDADADGAAGIDPLVNRFDLSDDPLAYVERRLRLSRELWSRVQERTPQPTDDATRQRRVLLSGFRQLGSAADVVAKYVGGMYTLRDLPGTTGRAAYAPVEPARQREALEFISRGLFNADSFRFKPQFLASLSPDYDDWSRAGPVSIPNAVLQMQSNALDRLLSAGTASRLLDLPLYVNANDARGLISLSEVYTTLQGSIWSELKSGTEIDRLRRNLQREHLKRVQVLLTRGSSSLPPDALSLLRLNATTLKADLRRAGSRSARLSVESRAHLQDSLSTLTEALRASMTRG